MSTIFRNFSTKTAFEPCTIVEFLPGCTTCGAPHPRALDAASTATICQSCGAPVVRGGQTQIVQSSIQGISPSAIVARAMLAIGRFLRGLAKDE